LFQFVFGLTVLAGFFALSAWIAWRLLKRSEDPMQLASKWLVSLVTLGVLLAACSGLRSQNPAFAFIVPITAAACGVTLGIVWAPNLARILASPITSAFDGGMAEGEPVPLYSKAEARRKRGQTEEAMAEVRRQLEQFPTDFQGWMLLAEIQAEDQRDCAAACATVEACLSRCVLGPKNAAYALSRCADWTLKLENNPSQARAYLQRITEQFPDTEPAQLALQRMARLNPDASSTATDDPPKLQLKAGPQRLGLAPSPATETASPAEEDPAAAAARMIQRLQTEPNDHETREQLAMLYGNHYARFDLAEAQLEQLIQLPGAPQKQIVRWLNLLADLYTKSANDLTRGRAVLQRIVDQFPGTSFAEKAMSRMSLLNLESRSQQQRTALKLGDYEKNLGLKPPKKS
jgi:tetratricopeptide (TPR) repeat protein